MYMDIIIGRSENYGIPEWTETDDSGSVLQITQIKTETSIKLEGEGAVRGLRKTPKRESSDEEKKSTDSEQEDLSFTEKKSFFQGLSLTSDTLPTSNKWAQDVSLDDLPMAEGEIIQEQISFEDKLKMFEPDESNRKKIQKREKSEQPTVYVYNFTKTTPTTDSEPASEIVEQVRDELGDDDNAVTLDKVEQEVFSLINKVDQEEKELHSYEERSESHGIHDSEHSGNEVDEPKSLVSDLYEEKSMQDVEGDDLALDSEDFNRATTTTTTRIVTTVTTDQDGGDQQGEDLRHSVEVILNQFMSDGDTSKQEDSHSGPEE